MYLAEALRAFKNGNDPKQLAKDRGNVTVWRNVRTGGIRHFMDAFVWKRKWRARIMRPS